MLRPFNLLAPLRLFVILALTGQLLARDVNPYPPRPVAREKLVEWTFEQDTGAWSARSQCELAVRDGNLVITAKGSDPYLSVPVRLDGEEFLIRLRYRSNSTGSGQIFWTTDRHPQESAERVRTFPMIHDSQWHEAEVYLRVDGMLTRVRLDPGVSPGEVRVDRFAIHRASTPPLTIENVNASPTSIRFELRNTTDQPRSATVGERTVSVGPGKSVEVTQPAEGDSQFELVRLVVKIEDWPPLVRRVVIFRPQAKSDSLLIESDRLAVRVARDGSGARVERGGQLVAIIAPLVLAQGELPSLAVGRHDPASVALVGEGIRVELSLDSGEIVATLRSRTEIEGPVVRAIGQLEQAVFPGIEYLGRGERSSSKLDIETDDHLRFTPDPLHVTLPLMSCRTDRATVALTWKDTTLQPLFAVPNFIDGTPDHRMALRGGTIDARVLISRDSTEESILWGLERFGGLPPLPEVVRSPEEQLELALQAIRGPIRGEGGWGHCAEERWPRNWHADIASTIWRITGEVPEMGGPIVPGGAHVRNDAIYFVTGNARRYLEVSTAQARTLIRRQKDDGSFRYQGRYLRGHFEDTASGFCARPAVQLLEFARVTGDREALAAAVKALEFMKRFRTPRGAQVWELSLHTPDILACANLVWAYVRGFELTGNEEYLRLARRWAISGIPFVYFWNKYPVMRYSTIPVFGATNWRAPLWIGLPVQWCGGVYAYALTLLDPHDDALDWNQLALGILVAAQQMQYPDGPLAGCLPDFFQLRSQKRGGPSINPSALVSLQLALEGKVDSLSVAFDGDHRVVAPFPVTIEADDARIEARPGVVYQVLVDGERIIDVVSRGVDRVELRSGRTED